MDRTPHHDIREIEEGLDHFSAAVRKDCLVTLTGMVNAGLISLPDQQEIGNLHCHTFFSYNGYGFSPSHLAWLGRQLGASFMGIVDFDVLDGVDEFLEAGALLGLRASAGLETRVYIPEYAEIEINSPGEPGICYFMGLGFPRSAAPDQAAGLLRTIRKQAALRNQEMLKRLNDFLAPLALDYSDDVLTRTPNRNATERHMLDQIIHQAQERISDPVAFWSEKLEMSAAEVMAAMQDGAGFSGLVRKKLMKKGGVGYIQPSPRSFPTLEELNAFTQACGALPCFPWLDGTSAGEQDPGELLDFMRAQGAVMVNIIPDRNWNIANRKEKTRKLDNLYGFVKAAQARAMPINVGTEMNSYGQRWMDDFNAPELQPVRAAFLQGAYFIYGHTQMQRTAKLGWSSPWAQAHFPQPTERNAFYEQVGRRLAPQSDSAERSAGISDQLDPQEILNNLSEPKEMQIHE